MKKRKSPNKSTTPTRLTHHQRRPPHPTSSEGLRACLEDSCRSGLFTHAYAACGQFDEGGAPRLACEVSVGGSVDTCFDLASLTKALVTTPLIFREALISAGGDLARGLALNLGEFFAPVASGLPDGLRRQSIEHFLAHRSGLPAWRSLWVRCNEKSLQSLTPRELVWQRVRALGAQLPAPPLRGDYCYSDLGFILLGLCLEERYGRRFDEIFAGFCAEVLALHPSQGLCFFTESLGEGSRATACAPSGWCRVRRRFLQGEVHDENAYFLGGAAGHAGAFASGPELLAYFARLLASPLGKTMVEENATRRLSKGANQGLCGWQQGTFGGGAEFGAGAALGHLGFTGTALWYQPERRAYGILLTNRVVRGRCAGLDEIAALRRKVFSHFSTCLDR